MDTLDRYLIREIVVYLLLIVAGMVLLALGIDFLTNYWASPFPISTITLLYAYRIPDTIQRFMPLSCLMASLLVLSSMSRQNEVLALYSSGISTLRILSTFVAVVAVASTSTFLVCDSVVPMFVRKTILVMQGQDPSSSENLTSFTRSKFWYRSGHLVYHVGRFEPKTNMLHDVRIYVFSPSRYLLERIEAKEAFFDGRDWELRNGVQVRYPDTQYPVATDFRKKRRVIPEKPKDFKTLKIRDETMRLKDLRQSIQRNREYGLDTTVQQVNYHERVALVFTPLVLLLIGFPFAVRPGKSYSAGRSVSLCLGLIFIYLMMSRLTLSMGKSGHIPAIMAAWVPNVLFAGVAFFRLGKSNA